MAANQVKYLVETDRLEGSFTAATTAAMTCQRMSGKKILLAGG